MAAVVHKLKLFEEVKMGAKEREENLQKESYVLCLFPSIEQWESYSLASILNGSTV